MQPALAIVSSPRNAMHMPQAIYALRIERVRAALADEPIDAIDASLAALGRRGLPDRRLGLSPDVLDFLWTAVALEADPRLPAAAERRGLGDTRRGATLALHVALFGLDGERARALSAELEPGRPARRLLLAAAEGVVHGATPFTVPARVRGYLAGVDEVDPLVRRVGGPLRPGLEGAAAPPALIRALDDEGPLLVVVEGPAGGGRRAAVAAAAAVLGRTVVELDLERWDPRAAPVEALVAAWARECLLRDALGLVSNLDRVAEPDERRRLALALDEQPGVLAATARAGATDLGLRRPVVRVSIATPEAPARRELWRRALGASAGSCDLDLLARRYRMGAGAIERAVAAGRLVADGPLGTAAVVAGVRASVADRLGDLATRPVVTQGWDDLILPRDTLDQLRALVARVRHAGRVLDGWGFAAKLPRGQGIAALLSGPPGTGKTMAAGILARELDLELWQVDLSRVVSKWLGETEKQLGALFDAAEAGHALLLFDEADSLFARRTEVKGAQDRYANLEVNYLLQRIETFQGITVLTTNLETAIDPAVRRRLAAHVCFLAPDEEEREALWRRMIPAAAPVAGALDPARLAAEFPHFSGAHIRNAALAAAFLAAAEDTVLSQDHLVRAARIEYQAMGRVLCVPRAKATGGGKS